VVEEQINEETSETVVVINEEPSLPDSSLADFDQEAADNLSIEDSMNDKSKTKSKGKSKRAGASADNADSIKFKANVPVSCDSQLNRLIVELKNRGIKNVDVGPIISEALELVPEDWWLEKLQGLTPIEVRVQLALKNPEMRAKLLEVLSI